MLNEPENDVAPSDSRHRPDMRLMEEGDLEQADKIMHALEVKHSAEKKNEPVWFEKKMSHISNETFYHFKCDETYWECKRRNDWSKSPSSLFKL